MMLSCRGEERELNMGMGGGKTQGLDRVVVMAMMMEMATGIPRRSVDGNERDHGFLSVCYTRWRGNE